MHISIYYTNMVNMTKKTERSMRMLGGFTTLTTEKKLQALFVLLLLTSDNSKAVEEGFIKVLDILNEAVP